MKPLNETKVIDGNKVELTWVSTDDYSDLRPITQAYGVCFRRDGRILVIRPHDRDPWALPGGRPEGNERPEETLIREILEEAAVQIERPVLLGYQKVHYPNNPAVELDGVLFYQLRFAALIKRIDPIGKDPASRITYERKWINAAEFNDYLHWGAIGKAIHKCAMAYYENIARREG